MAYKRKLEDFDPNKSDSDDLDYGAQRSPRARPARSRKTNKSSPRKPVKRRRETYNDSDIDQDSEDPSEEEDSFGESDSEEEQPVELNPRTGRGVRSAAKKPIKYEESDEEDEIPATDSETDPLHRSPAKRKTASRHQVKRGPLIVKLKLPLKSLEMDDGTGRPTRTRPTSSRSMKREPTPQASGAAGARRSSRLSHDEQQPLVALTDSGRHEVVTRTGTVTPEPEAIRRPSRGGKGLKKPPSAIFEVSQEDSVVDPDPTAEDDGLFSQLQEAADGGATRLVAQTSPTPEAGDETIQMEYAGEDEDEDEEVVVQESQPDPEDGDDDEEPVSKKGRSLRGRRKASTPPRQELAGASRRSLRNRKSGAEQSSDFEPDQEGDADMDEDLSESDELLKPPRGRSSAEASSQGGRRSGRLARKSASNRSRSRRSVDDDELDPEEIADEAAELDEDARRIRRERPRKRAPQRSQEINYEPTGLRNRGNRPDYRIMRPELLVQMDEDDAPPVGLTATPSRNRRGGASTHTYRSLFSTYGPFGGAGGPPPVLGGPDGVGATGGVDSDSSDDEGGTRGAQPGVGGTLGMTPTSAYPKPFSVPQALNNDPLQGPGGGPPGLGRIKDKKALADADPLGVDPNVTFDGVGGLDDHINQLKEMVTLPLLYPEVYQRFHVTPPRGVLFHGPPGTGKTLLARALASSVSSHGQKVTFYMRKGADALSKWVGEAEKQLRLLFEEARKNQPSIIFFDEIDGLAPVRSSKQEQIHASIVATLLALMDGMDGRGQVIVIGATNRPDSVDPALRRPGRFDREFYFPLPDAAGRRKIIDIHTKGWDPPLQSSFKDQLADLTRGYGGADLRALCTEAALNAVQGTYPQIYSSDQKLIIDPAKIKVLAKDFMISVNKIIPSSERSAASGAAPLKKDVEPLLREPMIKITELLDQAIPRKRKASALEEALYDDRDDELGFEKENMQRNFEAARVFRPRLLIKGLQGMGQQYLGAALLSKFEGLHVQNFDLPTLMKDSTRSPEAAVVQLFEEVKRHKPSVIYIPNINVWYDTLADTVKRTFVGMLRSLSPTDPVLLLGIMETGLLDEASEAQMISELFGYSTKNQFVLERPDQMARRNFWASIVEYVRKAPTEFPEAGARKKRKLEELPVAPPPKAPEGPNKAELKAQKKKDRQTLNMLKMHIQSVMDQIKLKYKKFRNPIIEDAAIAYLFDDSNPQMLTTDLTEEQRRQQQLFRPYEVDKDDKGVPVLREVATGRQFYNLEIVTIEKRLSNGYYKRPKDFLSDIKRLAKDAKTAGDHERTIKANEMLSNVEVDMATLEQAYPVLCAECELVYQREQSREQERMEKVRQAENRGEEVPTIVPNVPPVQVSSTTEGSGPIMLGQEVPGRPPLPPMAHRPQGTSPESTNKFSSSHTNGSHDTQQTNGSTVPSQPAEDVEMAETQAGTQDQAHHDAQSQSNNDGHTQSTSQHYSQTSAHTRLQPGSQAEEYHNSASTTSSGQKTGSRSSGNSYNTQESSESIRQPDFSMLQPLRHEDDELLPATQPPSLRSQPSSSQNSQPSQAQHRSANRAFSISALIDNGNAADNTTNSAPVPESEDATTRKTTTTFILDESSLQELHAELTERSSGLSVEQMEQIHAAVMAAIWDHRGEWNRNLVWNQIQLTFNAVVNDIEKCQYVQGPSQRINRRT